MALSPASVSGVVFTALVGPEAVEPLAPGIPITLPLNFSQAKNIKIFSGCYTPKADFLYLLNQFSNYDAPNWMIVVSDGQLNLTMTGTFISDAAFKRFAFMSWVNSEGRTPQALYIEGRTTMPQDEPCDYTIIVGQGVVT